MSHPVDEFTLTSKRTPAARGHLRREVIIGAILLAAAFVVKQLYFPNVLEHPLPFLDGPSGFKVYADPLKGWTLAFPESWQAEASTQRGRTGAFLQSSGITLSNIRHPFPDGAMTTPVDPRLVAMQVWYSAGRHFMMYCRTDTKLPLTLKGSNQRRRIPILDASGGEVTHLFKSFSKGGDPLYRISVYIGSKAPPDDIDLMEAIVGSINYTSTRAVADGQLECSKGVPPW